MQTSSTGVSRTRQVVAAVIGNALEWYDFIVYGFLASIIARQFFPSEDEYASLLMALATFGVGFLHAPGGRHSVGHVFGPQRPQGGDADDHPPDDGVHRADRLRAELRRHRHGRAVVDRGRADAPGLRHRWRIRQRHGVSGGKRPRASKGFVRFVAIGRAMPGGVFRGGDGGVVHSSAFPRGAGQLGLADSVHDRLVDRPGRAVDSQAHGGTGRVSRGAQTGQRREPELAASDPRTSPQPFWCRWAWRAVRRCRFTWCW